jgi:HSP20 family protein
MPQVSAAQTKPQTQQSQSQDKPDDASLSWKPEEVPQLTVDVYRQKDTIFVVSTVAGVNPKDLDISIENNTLSIKGVRRKPYEETVSTILLEECFWGEFYRELTINENIDVDSIKATINQGVLIVEVPILQITPHRKIEVDLKGNY